MKPDISAGTGFPAENVTRTVKRKIRQTSSGYAFAAVCVAGALGARWVLSPLLEDQFAFLPFVLSAMASAWFGGVGPGLAALVFGGLLGEYFFSSASHTFGPTTPREWSNLLTYSALGGTSILILEVLRTAQWEADEAKALAENRGQQLRACLGEISSAEARLRDLGAAADSARQGAQRFEAVADTAALMIWITDAQQRRTWVNQKWRSFTGRTLEEETGENWSKAVHPDDVAVRNHTHATAMEQRRPFEVEYRLRRADGEYRWVLEQAVPQFAPDGAFLGYSGSCMDVTERKQAEEALDSKFKELRTAQATLRKQNEELAASRQALEAERSRYRELFDSAPVGYIITSRHGIVLQVNKTAVDLLQESAEFLTGFPLARLIAREDRATFFANIARLARHEIPKIENWEATLQPPGRAPFPCSLSVNLLEEGQLTGLRWILRDVTERRQVEERILRLNAELEQRVRERTAALEAANRELEAFSYSVSHDLRAPLRSINGFSKAVLEDYGDKLDEQGVRYLQYAHEASLRLSRLVDDLLTLSRINRGEINRSEVDLSALATLVVAELRKSEPQRQVQVTIAPKLLTVGDEGLLRIALENLLSNAWKFTSRRPVAKIEIGRTQRDGNPLFFVRDNGAGFNMNHSNRLFGVFQRLHSQEEFPGIGIGLATVRRIFTRHGGEIWAEGKPNEGATFYFQLPNGTSHEAPALDADTQAMAN